MVTDLLGELHRSQSTTGHMPGVAAMARVLLVAWACGEAARLRTALVNETRPQRSMEHISSSNEGWMNVFGSSESVSS